VLLLRTCFLNVVIVKFAFNVGDYLVLTLKDKELLQVNYFFFTHIIKNKHNYNRYVDRIYLNKTVNYEMKNIKIIFYEYLSACKV